MLYLILLLGIAVYYDVRYFRIPNVLIVIGMLTGMVYRVVNKTFLCTELFLGMLIPVLVLFLLFYLHMLGAGDIKLLSMTGIFLGTSILGVIWKSFIIAAVLSFFQLVIQKKFRNRILYFIGYCLNVLKTGKAEPYYQAEQDQFKHAMHFSVAIFGAVILYYFGI